MGHEGYLVQLSRVTCNLADSTRGDWAESEFLNLTHACHPSPWSGTPHDVITPSFHHLRTFSNFMHMHKRKHTTQKWSNESRLTWTISDACGPTRALYVHPNFSHTSHWKHKIETYAIITNILFETPFRKFFHHWFWGLKNNTPTTTQSSWFLGHPLSMHWPYHTHTNVNMHNIGTYIHY